MSYSDNTAATGGHHLISQYDVIYVDACTWMAAEMESFLQQAAPHIQSSGHKLIMTDSVLRELNNCAPLKYAAQTALRLKEQYNELIATEDSSTGSNTADGEFVRAFFFNHNKRRQLLITHDQQLATDIQNCCGGSSDEETPATAVMTLWPDGDLITFRCMMQRKDQQARMRLAEMAGNAPIYLDSTALSNEQLPAFLSHLHTPLLIQERPARVISNSLTPEQRNHLATQISKYPGLLEIIETDSTLSETDALLGEIYLNPDNMGTDRIILVTHDVARANELRSRRPKCDRFPYIDFMTINKYAYLSYLKLSTEHTPAPRPPQQSSPRATAPAAPRERKPAAYVPQLIGAIKNDDIETMCTYIAKGASLRNGLITSLCREKDNCLRVLLETASTPIDPGCFDWWVCTFNSFAEPDYLAQNPTHFELLSMLITKSAPLTDCTEAMYTLAERVSTPNAAQEPLWEIIRLALQNGAPAAVYSRTSGETLPEIATRQGNTGALAFLQAR